MGARILVLALALLALALAAVSGCGGEEDVSPTPETVEGEVPQEETGETGGGGGAQGDAAAGKEVFASAGCGNCHVLADANASGSVGPSLDDSSAAYEDVVTQVTDGGGGMPAFSGQLSEQEIADVSAYVVEARGG